MRRDAPVADGSERYQIELGPPPDNELIPLRRGLGIGSEKQEHFPRPRRAGASLMREQPTRVTRWTRAGALLALILVAELGATAGAAEPATPKCDVNASPLERQLNRQLNRQLRTNPCPPGQRIEVAFGDTSLLIDPAWLQSITWLNDQTGCLCPEEAVAGFRFLQIFYPP